jgi:hypothetical protein
MLPQYPNPRETATADDEEFEVTQEADPWVRTPNWLLTRVPPAAVVAYCHLAARSPVRHSTVLGGPAIGVVWAQPRDREAVSLRA